MWNHLWRLLFFLFIMMISLVATNDVHTIYKMGKTSWGGMTRQKFCPTSTYVIGFHLRVHAKQGLFKDDSGLNGIQLKCSDGSYTDQLTGPRGQWAAYRQCTGGRHVTGFNLRSEGKQAGDDAAATDVAMLCSDGKESLYGGGLSWGSWEVSGYQKCPKGSYFCGVQARIEHGGIDNTGLNQMFFICCHIVNGGWGEWTAWSSCSTTCNTGIHTRTRKCDNPKPMKEGLLCTLNKTKSNIEKQIENCHMSPCPVDGVWSSWSAWSQCSVTCSNGTQSRTRHCGNPHPLHGGSKCIMGNGKKSNLETEKVECNEPPCVLSTITPYAILTMPPAKQLKNNDGTTSFIVQLVPLASNIRHYDIIVTELKDNGEYPRADPNTYTNKDIFNNVDGIYVAGRVFGHNVLSKTFVVGDINNDIIRKRRNLAEPINKPLKEGVVYAAFIRGYVTDEYYITSPWLPPVRISSSGSVGASTQNEVVFNGTTVAVALVLGAVVVVLLILLLWKRRRQQRWKQNNEIGQPVEMNEQAGNQNVYGCGMVTSCDNDAIINDEQDTRSYEHSSHHQRSGSRYSLPVYADILTVGCTKYPDSPPAYEEIQETRGNTSSQVSSASLTNTIQHENKDYNAGRGYQELTNRLPQQNPMNQALPGYDSLAHHPVHEDRSIVTNGQEYNTLNVTTEANPVTTQQQDYDHLHENTCNVSTNSFGQPQMSDPQETQEMRTYENVTDEDNTYEPLHDDANRLRSDYKVPYTV